MKVSRVMPVDEGADAEVGKVIALPPTAPAAVGVQTGEGILGMLRVQLEGKREMEAREFLIGHRDFVGSLLL